MQYVGTGLALLSGFTMSINSVWNRKLKNLDYYVVMLYHGILGTILAIIFITIEGAIKGELRFYTGTQYLFLTLAGIMDMLTVNFMTIAF